MYTKNMPISPQRGIVLILIVIVITFAALIGFAAKDTLFNLLRKTSLFPETAEVPVTPFVKAYGTKLYLNGQPYQFTGVNAFHLGTWPGANAGCGGVENDLDAFFANLRPNSVVRTWAFQGGQSTNVITKKIDWSGLDRVVNAAQQNNVKLILVLGDQSGTCDDGHWKDNAWYSEGFKQAINDLDNGLTPLPYLEYVKLIVDRYKDSTAIAMWEPINEPEVSDCKMDFKGSTCYGNQTCVDEESSAKILRSFFDTVGSTIKSIDKNHLISSGVIGDGQCGAVWENYKYVHQSTGIDVASYHDYHRDTQPMPGDQWNGLQTRLDQMTMINKPLIVGEVGIKANDNDVNCMTYESRRKKLKAKMDAQFAAGVVGFLPWAFTNGTSINCNYDIVRNDPILTLLRDYPVSIGTTTPRPSGTASVGAIYTFKPQPSPVKPSPSPDLSPPSAPTGLVAQAASSTQINLKWKASTDNFGVIRYDIFKNDTYLTSTSGTSFNDTKLSPKTLYKYHVKAKDAASNNSAASNISSATTY